MKTVKQLQLLGLRGAADLQCLPAKASPRTD